MTPLERIIGACADDEAILARGQLLDTPRRDALGRLADRRLAFIDDLRTAGRTLYGAPRVRRSWSGAWRRLALDARIAAAGVNAGDVVRACRRSQERLETCLAAAPGRAWSPEIRRLLAEERAHVFDARAVLARLL